MAEEDDSGQEKTEEPTYKKVEEFREEGQVAKTQEVGALIGVTVSFIILSMQSDSLGHLFRQSIETAFSFGDSKNWVGHILFWMNSSAMPIMKVIGIFMITMLVITILGSYFQTGFLVSMKSIEPKFQAVNPYEGVKKLFSSASLVQLRERHFPR